MRSVVFIIVFTIAALANACWLFEIVELKGWYSLNWLHKPLYSPYLIALLAAISYIIPQVINKQISVRNIVLSVITLCVVNVFCFNLGRYLCEQLYTNYGGFANTELLILLLYGLFLYTAFGYLYWLVTNRLINTIKQVKVLQIVLLSILALPLSQLTVNLFTGLGAGTDWIDAVKMGYPVFWTTLALGLSGMLINKHATKKQL